MNARRLVAVVAGAVVLAGAVAMLRTGVQPPPRPVTGPDGQRISAYHDPALVVPPPRPGAAPHRPGRLHIDARRGGALVSWPPAPYSFEVRWSGADGATSGVRLVVTPATSFEGLPAGRYHVEVRSVDEVGRRSEPTSADVEVSDDVPSWQRGLGFVDDFSAGAGLDASRWRLPNFARQCLRREGNPGPLMLDGRCGGMLRPTSQLVLAGSGEVLGRVVVLADAPSPPQPSPYGPTGPPEDLGWANYLVVGVAQPPPVLTPASGVQLWIGSQGAFLTVGNDSPDRPQLGQRLDGGSPGALHRWELVFTADEVRAYRDGEQVGSADYRAPWQRADVSLAAYVGGDPSWRVGARVGLVGFTGDAPDGRAVELVELVPEPVEPTTELHFAVPAAPTAQRASLTGVLVSPGPAYGPASVQDYRAPPPPDVVAHIGGLPLELHRQPSGYPDDPSVWLSADVPASAVRGGGTLTLRSANGVTFVAVQAELEVTHQPGVVLDVQQPWVDRPAQPVLPTPRLTIRYRERTVTGSDPAPRGKLEVEVQVDGLPAQAVGRGVGGWVALRVELDGRRILDFPTATDGPAVAGSYRFTLDTTDLPNGYYPLVVSLIPERAGLAGTTERATLRLTS
ncbi:MAG TPA: hypothetical protein VGJ95_10605 [Pseudonocardiaceae bacterium]